MKDFLRKKKSANCFVLSHTVMYSSVVCLVRDKRYQQPWVVGKALAQAAHRNCGCPIPASVGLGLEQPWDELSSQPLQIYPTCLQRLLQGWTCCAVQSTSLFFPFLPFFSPAGCSKAWPVRVAEPGAHTRPRLCGPALEKPSLSTGKNEALDSSPPV